MQSYLQAYFGDSLSENDCRKAVESQDREETKHSDISSFWLSLQEFATKYLGFQDESDKSSNVDDEKIVEAKNVVSLLSKNTEELDSVLSALDGGYVKPAPGGDLLR